MFWTASKEHVFLVLTFTQTAWKNTPNYQEIGGLTFLIILVFFRTVVQFTASTISDIKKHDV